MRSLHCIVLALVAVLSVPALGDGYIVLFQQSEIGIASLGHGGYQNLLQSSNEKSLLQLKEWLGRRGRDTAAGDLWLVRGSRVDIDAQTAAELRKEAWVHDVVPDLTRQFVHPVEGMSVHGSLAEAGETPGEVWGLKAIGLPKIREEWPSLDGSGVRVGILDTGIQSRHPEFRREGGYVEVTFRDFLNKLPFPYDDHGHGTHVAGTIAGQAVGIAPNVSLLVAKVFTAGGSGTDSTLLAAMQWVFDPDGDPSTDDFAHLVSNSWGATLAGNGPFDIAQFEPYRRAIQSWIGGGIYPIFAAGNSGGVPNGIPGGLPEAFAVGAIQPSGAIADFSSRGPNIWRMDSWVLTLLKPDVSAPGVDVTSAFPGNKYATWAGTSMATPHVSGALALMLQANHKITYAEAKHLLMASSDRKADVSFGYGVLNAYELIRQASSRRPELAAGVSSRAVR